MDECAYWLAFSKIEGLGSKGVQALLAHFGSAESAWRAPARALAAIPLSEAQRRAFLRGRGKVSPAAELARLEAVGARALTWADPAYPPLLRMITDPPVVLFLQGELVPQDQQAVAVVGSRYVSAVGKEVAWRLARDLARRGVTVVSGLARGIDSAAHWGALAGGGRTLAVLGAGIGSCYPPEHQDLYQKITRQGAVLSEYPPGIKPMPGNFPARNRLISGLALGVVVVEARAKSGALITVDFALEQGREVFAVPGDILRETTQGSNNLLKQGAKLVAEVDDILEELPPLQHLAQRGKAPPAQQILFPLTPTEEKILRLIRKEATHLDLLLRGSGLPAGRVESALLQLELKGLIRRLPGGFFVSSH